MTRIGSLFSGYGGLDLAVEQVTGATTAWVSDIDPGACRILAHRYPDVPNIGDIAKVDWSTVEPVDILTGGFPCQDVSHAGKRAGLHAGTRTGLWSRMAEAIDQLRPRLVVAENVRGLLSASATSDLEPCPWCVGDDESGALRALGAVLGDLAELGYDARVCGLRAADVGAPHGRFRVFVVAYPAGDSWRFGYGDDGSTANADRLGRQRAGSARGRRAGLADDRLTAADPKGDGRQQGRTQPARLIGGPDAPERSAPVADAGGERHGGREDGGGVGRVDCDAEGEAWQRERPRPVTGDRSATPTADTGHATNDGQRARPESRSGDAWGQYEPAIRRWERVLGRVAPPPTETAPKGGQRLSPGFVEWMMGLPAGHVTDPAIWHGMTPSAARNAQLKALGNGVVPQQAAAALTHLLASLQRAA